MKKTAHAVAARNLLVLIISMKANISELVINLEPFPVFLRNSSMICHPRNIS